MDSETIVDKLDRVERSVTRIEKLLDGDVQLGLRGVSHRVTVLEEHVASIQGVRVSAMQWLLGYLLFGLFVLLTADSTCNALGVPQQIGLVVGGLAFVLAAIFFVSGLGWLRWR